MFFNAKCLCLEVGGSENVIHLLNITGTQFVRGYLSVTNVLILNMFINYIIYRYIVYSETYLYLVLLLQFLY